MSSNGNGNGNRHQDWQSQASLLTATKQYDAELAEGSFQYRAEGTPGRSSYGYDVFGLRDYFDRYITSGYADEMPAWGTRARDVFLRRYLQTGPSLLQGVVYGEATRAKTMPFAVSKQDDRHADLTDIYTMLDECDFGGGFADFVSKLVVDYLTQDNGFFVELIPGDRENGKRFIAKRGDMQLYELPAIERTDITSFATLDPSRCWRSLDPVYPVFYTNSWTGEIYAVHYTRIVAKSQMPMNFELGRGVGMCALGRAYGALRIIEDIELYLHEKVAGQAPEIIYTQGINIGELKVQLDTSRRMNDTAGFRRAQGAHIVGSQFTAPNTPPVRIERFGLRDIPDGFNPKEWIQMAAIFTADAFGVSVRDIMPGITTGETKADAEVQERAASGKGRDDAIKTIEKIMNTRILPPGVELQFNEIDDTEDERRAEIRLKTMQALTPAVQSGMITSQQALQQLTEEGLLLADFHENVGDETSEQETEDDATDIGIDIEDSELEALEKARRIKAYVDTKAGLLQDLQDLILQTPRFGGELQMPQFIQRMQDALVRLGIQAYIDGMKDGGATQASIMTLTDLQQGEMMSLIRQQQGYVPAFARSWFVQESPLENIINRIGMWINKGLGEIYQAGLTAGAGAQPMEWVLGPTEHCETCLIASGQVHTADEWKASGILPQSSSLACGGFNCQCQLVPTDRPIQGNIEDIPIHGSLR